MLIVFFEREDVDRRQFCRCIIGVSGVPRGPYYMCKTKMAACALRIKCCVLESCCSFDGSVPSRSTHLSTEWDCFNPENWTDFLFQELPEDIQSKIVYIYSVINEYSLCSRDVHSTPSWHKWPDFEYRPWCLAIVVRTPPVMTESVVLMSLWSRAINILISNWCRTRKFSQSFKTTSREDSRLNFIRLLRVVITPSVTSESTGR